MFLRTGCPSCSRIIFGTTVREEVINNEVISHVRCKVMISGMSFCSSLDLDKEDLVGKSTVILEEGNSNATFAVNSLLWKCGSEPETGVLLLALHYPLHHYFHLGNKLGVRALPVLESGRLIGIDPKKELFDQIVNKTDTLFGGDSPDLRAVFLSITEKVNRLRDICNRVFIFVDDLSDLLNAGADPKGLLAFLHSLRTLVGPRLGLVVASHHNGSDKEQELLKNILIRVSDICLFVAPLKTGISSDITGSIETLKRDCSNLSRFTKRNLHHYKLTDRTIKIFSPGSCI